MREVQRVECLSNSCMRAVLTVQLYSLKISSDNYDNEFVLYVIL